MYIHIYIYIYIFIYVYVCIPVLAVELGRLGNVAPLLDVHCNSNHNTNNNDNDSNGNSNDSNISVTINIMIVVLDGLAREPAAEGLQVAPRDLGLHPVSVIISFDDEVPSQLGSGGSCSNLRTSVGGLNLSAPCAFFHAEGHFPNPFMTYFHYRKFPVDHTPGLR